MIPGITATASASAPSVGGGITADPSWFVFTVNATTVGVTAAGSFKIPSDDTSYNLQWEEVGNETNNSGGIVAVVVADHVIDFGGNGTFRVFIDPVTNSSTFDYFRFYNGGDKLKFKSVEQWGTTAIYQATSMFYGCSNFAVVTATDTPNLSVTAAATLGSMFRGCSSLTNINNLSNWTIPPNTNLGAMFRDTQVNQSIGNWNIAAVTDMTSIFLLTDLSTANYDDILIKFSAQSVQSGVAFRVGANTKYTAGGAAATAKASLESAGWTFIDGGSV